MASHFTNIFDIQAKKNNPQMAKKQVNITATNFFFGREHTTFFVFLDAKRERGMVDGRTGEQRHGSPESQVRGTVVVDGLVGLHIQHDCPTSIRAERSPCALDYGGCGVEVDDTTADMVSHCKSFSWPF